LRNVVNTIALKRRRPTRKRWVISGLNREQLTRTAFPTLYTPQHLPVTKILSGFTFLLCSDC